MPETLTTPADALIRLYLLPMGWKLLGACAVWVVGGWAVRLIRTAFARFMRLRQFDVTLSRYLDASLNVLLKLFILIAMLSVLGIETTSFAALIAAVGIAIGAAWSGLLANFAAGLFLLTFRPFKVGDAIAAAGVTGEVREIGLFVTTIDTADHVVTFVSNNKLFADNVQNFSANTFRRVDVAATVPAGTNLEDMLPRLRERIVDVPNVLRSPAPTVEILTLNPAGSVLAVRPFCHHDHYWQVYFDTNRTISQLTA